LDDRGVLDIEHLEQVGGVGGELREVAEHAGEVLVVALDRDRELLLPGAEGLARGRIKRVVD